MVACEGATTDAPAVPDAPENGMSGAAVQAVSVQPETCGLCHPDAGEKHQASYDELYQDGVIEVGDLAYGFAEPGTTTVTFKMTKNGAAISGSDVQNLNVYFVWP